MIDRRSVLVGGFALGGCAAIPAQASGLDLVLGVCRGTADAHVSAAAGLSYLEVNCRSVLKPGHPRPEFEPLIERLAQLPLPARAANSFLPGSFQATGPNADPAPILDYAAVAFRRAAEVGIDTIVFGSSGARSIPDDFPVERADEQFVELLRRMGPLAGEHGVVVALEPLQSSETNYINTVRHGLRLVRAVDHPSIGLAPDLFHMAREEEDPDAIREAGRFVRHLHIAEKADRTAPGVRGDPFHAYFRAVRAAGYQGRLSFECRWSDFERELPRAVRTTREQLRFV